MTDQITTDSDMYSGVMSEANTNALNEAAARGAQALAEMKAAKSGATTTSAPAPAAATTVAQAPQPDAALEARRVAINARLFDRKNPPSPQEHKTLMGELHTILALADGDTSSWDSMSAGELRQTLGIDGTQDPAASQRAVVDRW